MWQDPPNELIIGVDQVDVWRINLQLPAEGLELLSRTLSPDEIDRSVRFHFQKDREQFIAARGGLRDILSRYLTVSPAQLQFNYSPYGKPALGGESVTSGLSFNLSHSHQLALVAVTRGCAVGVDLEWMRSELADEQIARRFFSKVEVQSLLEQPLLLQKEAFFTCWTRKEAYIKARGEGLSLPLDQFDVALIPGEPARLLATRPDPHEAERWSLFHLAPGPGYVAALAVAAQSLHLKYWQWNKRA